MKPLKIRKTIILDKINPQDYNKYIIPNSCEDCIHFGDSSFLCSLGYNTENHLKLRQHNDYHLSGRMALCRFHEII